ncbi:hypothetical protein Vau01_025930 [Virgisporangium aurantiacum]|uniref:Uncharacterized protein n=1 Tax=Virgisporangium aurantiacum TaxID=175570 RepID=A0A8J4E0J5_9ACTN|nr:hypothetical protein Vau01_025930 [Virgisporangium aurantiacum]
MLELTEIAFAERGKRRMQGRPSWLIPRYALLFPASRAAGHIPALVVSEYSREVVDGATNAYFVGFEFAAFRILDCKRCHNPYGSPRSAKQAHKIAARRDSGAQL